MLLNKNFLLQLDQQQNTEKYARITLLTNKELPIEQIEGRITSGGSISIDGKSAIRRTCSLTMVSQDTNYHTHYWTLKSKFKLEIGIRNNINSAYPDIIWFPQGIYVFTSFSINHSVNNFTISLQGKDKGCLINGEVNGSFNSLVDLGSLEEIDEEGNSTITKLDLKDIIINMMHQYAGEPLKNIIVNDLDEMGFELLEYKGKKKLFLFKKENDVAYSNIFFEDTAPIVYREPSTVSNRVPVDFTQEEIEGLDTLMEDSDYYIQPSLFYMEGDNDNRYYITKIQYGQTAGYRTTRLVFAGDLIATTGDSIASILDKIKNMLGEYEYFYDVEGRFVFQKKRYYVDSPIGQEGNEEEDLPRQEEIAYTLTSMQTVSSFSSNPNLSNLKNDFSIWGEKKTSVGASIPIHLRYAVDEKPLEYTRIEVKANEGEEDYDAINAYNDKYKANISGQSKIKYVAGNIYTQESEDVIVCDWREIIYRMALDYSKYGFLDNFELKVIAANTSVEDGVSKNLYPTGITGYEQYYVDILGFWRDLYFPEIFGYNEQLISKENELKEAQDNKDIVQKNLDEQNNKIKQLENRNKELAKIVVESRLPTPQFIIIDDQTDTPDDQKFLLDLPQFEIVSTKRIATPNMRLEDEKSKLLSPTFSIVEMAANNDGKILLSPPSTFRIEEILNGREALEEIARNLTEIQRIYDEDIVPLKNSLAELNTSISTFEAEIQKIKSKMMFKKASDYYDTPTSENYCWNKNKDLAPELLNFWFDFLDNESAVSDYSVQKIGARAKPVNDNKINAIFFRKVPEVIFVSNLNTEQTFLQGYKYLQINGLDSLFSQSAQGKSAKDELNNLLYNHLFTADNVNITAKPVYYLEPNTKIRVIDKNTDTSEDYIISRISLPLTYNGMMTITANKSIRNIL